MLNGTEAAFAPAMFMFSPLAQKYVAAVRSDGQYLGPANLYPGLTVPAHAGDVILLYGTGFGPTNPATNFSQTFSGAPPTRSEEHTSELQSLRHLVCRLLLEKKKHITR